MKCNSLIVLLVVTAVAASPASAGPIANSLWIGTDNTISRNVLNVDRQGHLLQTVNPAFEASGIAVDLPHNTIYFGTSGFPEELGAVTATVTPTNLGTLAPGTPVNLAPMGVPRFLYEDMAFDGTDLWRVIIDGLGIDSTVERIDPATGNVVSSFSVGFEALGLAWDGSGLWVSDFSGNRVLRFDTSGNPTGQVFPTGFEITGGLAWDTTDNTLWVGTTGQVHHFSTAGTDLGFFDVPVADGRFVDGLEFEGRGLDPVVPEPSTLTLLGFGTVVLLACARRRREGAGSGRATQDRQRQNQALTVQ
jgi:hypothetical protein